MKQLEGRNSNIRELGRIAFYIYDMAVSCAYINENAEWAADDMYDILEQNAKEFVGSEYDKESAPLYECGARFVVDKCRNIGEEAMR